MNRIIFSLFILTSCTIKNEFSINDWAYYRGDNSVSHYKPFDLINKDNVHKLTKVWEYKSSDHDLENRSQIQCNPLIIDGVLFGTSAKMKLFALNASNGSFLWEFDP